MRHYTIGILGGSGFVGQHLCAALVAQGHRVRILSRNPHRYRPLTVLPTLTLIQGTPLQSASLIELLRGCDVAINLVGILNETGKHSQAFKQTHVGIPMKLGRICQQLQVPRILHMSALGADSANERCHYLSTKGEGEDTIHQAASKGCYVTSFRPSIIFGPGDHFFEHFAKLLKLTIGAFPLPCYQTQYAPLYVQDLVQVFIQAIDKRATFGKRYELSGPNLYSLYSLVNYTKQLIKKHCLIIGLNRTLSWMQACIMEQLPGKPFSRDNFWALQSTNASVEPLSTDFSLNLRSIESIVPLYIGPQRLKSVMTELRGKPPSTS